MSNVAVEIIKPEDIVTSYGRMYPAQGWSEGESLVLPFTLHISHSDCSMRSRRYESAASDGGWRLGGNWGERKFELRGRIVDASASELQDLQATINAFCSRPNLAAKWNGSYLFLNRFDRQNWRFLEGWGNRVAEVAMSWFASDPYWYDDPDVHYTDSQSLTSQTGIWIANHDHASTASAYPITTIGQGSSDFEIGDTITVTELSADQNTNLRTFTITIDQAMSPNDYLVINHEIGSVNWYDHNGADMGFVNSWLEGELFPFVNVELSGGYQGCWTKYSTSCANLFNLDIDTVLRRRAI